MAVPQVSQSPWAKVGVAGGEQPTGGVHGDEEVRALAELLDVDVAGQLAGRDGPQGVGGDVRVGGDGSCGRRGEHEAAAVEQRLFAGGGAGEQLVAGRQADRAHERGSGDADAGKVVGGGPAPGDVPVDLEGLGELVAEEPEPGYLDGVAVAVGFDVEDLDVEQVARLGAVDVDGAGQGMHHVEVRSGDVVPRGGGAQLSVEGVTGLEDHLVAGVAVDHRWDVGVPAVVAGAGLLHQRLGPVDADLRRGLHRVPPRLDRSCWPPSMS